MVKPGRIQTLMIVISVLLLMTVPLTTRAQDTDSTPESEQISFSLNPAGQPDGSFFEIEAAPGSTTSLTVEFANLYSQPLALRSFVSDGFTLVNGGLGISDEGQNSQPPTAWIDYPADTYELSPDEGREIDFTITVPTDAEPGNYVSVLVLQTVDAVPVEGTSLFDQIIQKAVAIDITVPGEMQPAFAIGEVTYSEGTNVPSLTIGIENTGNVRLRPAGTLDVVDSGGATVLSSDVLMGSIFAHTATALQFVLQQSLATGSYALTLNLTDPETGVTAAAEAVPFSVESATPVSVSLITFEEIQIRPLPDATAPQFASITGTIVNGGDPISNARLTLVALKDGEEVERFPLIPSLSLAQGTTPIEQRYIPATGFTSGTWTFQLTLESIDPASGTANLLTTYDHDQPLIVP